MEIIHIVLGKANPDRLNGVNKVVYHLATEQFKAGKKVLVWGITPNPVHDYPLRQFETRLFKAKKNPFAVQSAIKKAILDNAKATFHLHGGWIPVFYSLSVFLSKHNIRFVLTPHGAYNEVAMKRSSLIKKVYFHLFEKQVLKAVHKVHSIGISEVTGLSKLSPATKSFLLPYGFDFCPDNRCLRKENNFIIGFVGRLDVFTKGLDLLMEAFYEFQKTDIPTRLWVIGTGEGQKFIENFIKEKKLDNIILWGKKFGKEKDKLISQMHVFVHPSRNEGLPTAVLEAASMNIPVIVTEATNLAGYISDFQAGIAIADNTVQDLMNAIQQIHEDYQSNDIQKYLDGAPRMLREAFSWPLLVEKYDALYQ